MPEKNIIITQERFDALLEHLDRMAVAYTEISKGINVLLGERMVVLESRMDLLDHTQSFELALWVAEAKAFRIAHGLTGNAAVDRAIEAQEAGVEIAPTPGPRSAPQGPAGLDTTVDKR